MRAGEVVLKEVKGLIRTVGSCVMRPSSVIGRVGGGVANRELGGWLLRKGVS
jgi:hypothetical protein